MLVFQGVAQILSQFGNGLKTYSATLLSGENLFHAERLFRLYRVSPSGSPELTFRRIAGTLGVQTAVGTGSPA